MGLGYKLEQNMAVAIILSKTVDTYFVKFLERYRKRHKGGNQRVFNNELLSILSISSYNKKSKKHRKKYKKI